MMYIAILTISTATFLKAVSWGPYCFLYMLMILRTIPNIPIMLYADDTNLRVCGKSPNTVINDAEYHMANLMLWFSGNRISLSIKKTCFNIYHINYCDETVGNKIR